MKKHLLKFEKNVHYYWDDSSAKITRVDISIIVNKLQRYRTESVILRS